MERCNWWLGANALATASVSTIINLNWDVGLAIQLDVGREVNWMPHHLEAIELGSDRLRMSLVGISWGSDWPIILDQRLANVAAVDTARDAIPHFALAFRALLQCLSAARRIGRELHVDGVSWT